ncbi:MAG: electron transfer flavoprotein subunit beta/FixA family protein [Saccharofermentanales bacterium]
MNILVCVKQVPDTTEIKIDPVKKTLIRAGVPSILNTFDAYALEQALQLKDKDPDNVKIVVASMGPPQAETMLRDCIAVGAEAAYLITDRKFGGSDTYATSYILSEATKKIVEEEGSFDLIFCGKQAIDGDTAQVGPELAEHLGLHQITYAINITLNDEKNLALITRELDEGKVIVEAQLPVLVTFTKTDDLRFASIKNKMKSKKAEIKEINYEDLEGIDDTKIGLKGSPTRVVKSFTPDIKTDGIIIKEDDPDTAFEKFAEELEKVKLY